jgi:hypothetical protein
MRSHVCDSASVIGLCLMALYFAPMDAASNSGRFSSQTFRTSSLITGRTFLDAERKAFVRAIEFDLSPRGDDWICRTFILIDPNWFVLASSYYCFSIRALYAAASHRVASSRNAKPALKFALPLGYSFANSSITGLALNN